VEMASQGNDLFPVCIAFTLQRWSHPHHLTVVH
jgi:hypothetical protein